MSLPNFMCVGAGKSGTTSLHDILKQHSDIFLPEEKETTFFRDDKKYDQGIAFYKTKYFSRYRGEKAIGEIDPSYMFYEQVPRRLFEQLGGEIKLIFILRNPVDRAYSHYLMSRRRGYESEEFPRALSLESERIRRGGFEKEHFSYASGGLYATQIKRYLQYFRKENMMFILFEEDFIQSRMQTIIKLLNFLGVDYMPLNIDIKSNFARMPRSEILRDLLVNRSFRRVLRIVFPFRRLRDKLLSSVSELNLRPFLPKPVELELKRLLADKFFLNEITELEKIIDRDLTIWRA
jgi:hypothetical protein